MCRGSGTRRRGRKPYGYRANEAVAIERMMQLRSLGWGFDRIAMQLNDENLPSRDGKMWHGLVVNRICSRLQAARQNQQSAERAESGTDSSRLAELCRA